MTRENIFDLKRHHHRPDLAGEHRFGDAGQVILLITFMSVWISDSFFLHYSDYNKFWIPLFLRLPFALGVFVLSGYCALEGLHIAFGEVREPPGIIQKGVFNYVRHPIYLGCILFYVSLLIYSFSLAAFFICLGIIAFYHFIAKHEETLLIKKFGAEYSHYQARVPMWIPRLSSPH